MTKHTDSRKGLTLQKAVLELRTDSFADRQMYTALSRVRGRRDIQALFREEEETTANVVYRRLLLLGAVTRRR
ncbi:uncharacterized protein F5147DRAFT_730511 [Suillus discolor]|uniref:Uncharacterized protein n=1 Tax=Suillus discolor TaxID=1912936 RepID=A0A9P7JLM3_9AGAM|nr:uncharacterized protein F5147DRAFT_730511 [Suillus discolor]KAG2085399.1 hypothetical protein F5147DRAFT_730511 [Suillus discolor]